jgi:putative oxidoreductase
MSTIAAVIGRILLAALFIVSGTGKLLDLPGTNAALSGIGMGGMALPVALFEIGAGLCLALGLMTRLASLALIVFTALATLFFHSNFVDPVQSAMALKNVSIIGGLFLVFAHSQMWYGWDAMRRERRGELAARHAEEQMHEAELRAAKAEGLAAGPLPASGAPIAARLTDADGVPGVRTREIRRRRWF